MGSKSGRRQPDNQTSHHGGPYEPDSMDTTPLEMPAGTYTPESLTSKIARLVHAELQAEKDQEMETWDEANDFEPEDEELLNLTRYTVHELDDDLESQNPFAAPKPPPAPSERKDPDSSIESEAPQE